MDHLNKKKKLKKFPKSDSRAAELCLKKCEKQFKTSANLNVLGR